MLRKIRSLISSVTRRGRVGHIDELLEKLKELHRFDVCGHSGTGAQTQGYQPALCPTCRMAFRSTYADQMYGHAAEHFRQTPFRQR